MTKNLITVFARGNQELFHSAFIAWLLDKNSPHSLGGAVLEGLLSLLGLHRPNHSYTIKTEACDRSCRFDILIQSEEVSPLEKGLVIENKTKSLGQRLQLDRYGDEGYKVAALALLPQTLDKSTRDRYPIVEYRQICDIVSGVLSKSRSVSNPYHFVIDEYVRYLTQVLGVFDVLGRYCRGTGSLNELITCLSRDSSDVVVTDNDVRTLNYFYYHEFEKYLTEHRPELVFGACDYKEHDASGQNTRWIYEKNTRGMPYIEALVRDFSSGRFRLQKVLQELYFEKAFTLVPRIEVRLDPQLLSQGAEESTIVGEMLLGSWADYGTKHQPLVAVFREKEPYKSQLTPKPRARRNDHAEAITLGAIRFATMADRLKSLMEKIGTFE